MGEAWIIDAVRTPRGRGKREVGALSSVHPQELFAQPLNALRDRTGLDPAAMGVASGMQDLVAAGGMESMSRNPMGSDKSGLDGHNRHLRELHPLVPQGISADLIATLEGSEREDVDRLALSSQERCVVAQKEGRFNGSLIPVTDPEGRERI